MYSEAFQNGGDKKRQSEATHQKNNIKIEIWIEIAIEIKAIRLDSTVQRRNSDSDSDGRTLHDQPSNDVALWAQMRRDFDAYCA